MECPKALRQYACLHLRLSTTACSPTGTASTCNLPCHTLCNFERSPSPPQLGDVFWFYFIQVPTQILKSTMTASNISTEQRPNKPRPAEPDTSHIQSHLHTDITRKGHCYGHNLPGPVQCPAAGMLVAAQGQGSVGAEGREGVCSSGSTPCSPLQPNSNSCSMLCSGDFLLLPLGFLFHHNVLRAYEVLVL